MLMPINWRLEAPEQQIIISDCEPKVLFVDNEHVERGQQIIRATQIRLAGIETGGQGFEGLDDLVKKEKTLSCRQANGNECDPVLLCYTSGATGQPKGVVLTQKALLTNALNSRHMHGICAHDVVLTTLPLFHVGGLNILSTPILYCGGRLVLHPAFDVAQTFEALKQHKVTLTVLVPTQISAMMADQRWSRDALDHLRMITTGSTLVPGKLIDDVHKTGIPLIQVYGSTETAPLATYLTSDDAISKKGSGGKVGLHSEICIVDSNGDEVKTGHDGEILIRGDHVMSHYWNNTEATEQAFINGWYRSGDIGHVDEDGFLYVSDRKKDMIISGGENIYPAELENILAEHGAIVEAAVVGGKDERWGEIVVAIVVAKDTEQISGDDVCKIFDGKLARYKRPRRVVFIDALPRNAMGKINKNQLRDMVNDTADNNDRQATA